MFPPPMTLAADLAAFKELGVLADDDDGRKAHQQDHVEEVGHEAGRVQHGLAGFLGVGDGEEAHQDVRQASRTEHQAQTQGQGGDGVRQQGAREEQLLAQTVQRDGLAHHGLEAETELGHGQHHHQRATGQQHAGLDDLHPGGGDHATEGDVDHHQGADHEQGDVVVQAEQQLDQLAGTDHLGHQVETHHGQRGHRRHGAHLALVEPVGRDVGKGELAQVAQALGHQEQDDGPAGEEGDHVDVAIDALGVHQRGEAQQGGGGHVVAGNGQAVLEAGDATAGSVEVGSGLGTAGRPVGDAQGHGHEEHEHPDGVQIEGLLLGGGDRITGEGQGRHQQGQQGKVETGQHYFTSLDASRMISVVMASNSPLARLTYTAVSTQKKMNMNSSAAIPTVT
jgi:hypothetical protein